MQMFDYRKRKWRLLREDQAAIKELDRLVAVLLAVNELIKAKTES